MTDTSKKESQLQVVVITLLEAAGDKDHEVRESVITSLKKIAKKHSSFVLKSAMTFRLKNTKLSSAHLTGLLQTMEQICKNHLEDIKVDIIIELIEFSVQEMTQSADYQPEFQMPASGILVALGQTHSNEVMGGLLKQFHPGVVPHYSVLHTMGALASANAFGIVPFIKATLGTMLPMLGMLRTDAQKQVFAFTLGKFSEAVLEYLANIDQAPDSSVKKEAFSTEISIAYDILVNSWIHIKEPKVCVVVLQSLGPMFHLLPPVKVSEQVPRVIPVLLGLYRRNMDPLPVTQCLCAVLEVALKQNKTIVEPLLDNLQNIIFDLVCISPDYAQPATAKNHYEVLRCFDCIATYFADKVVELLIQQLKNNNEKERIKALFVVTHLVNSSENLIRSRTSDLTMALKNMLGEHNVKVKRILLKAIVAFAYRGYLEGSEGKDFVEFIVKHCCPQITNMAGKDPDFGSLMEELQMTCANTLYLLATTVPQVEHTLWLILLQCLLNSQYTVACSHIARCLAHLATKRKDEHNFTEHSSKLSQEGTGPHVVLGRCLVLLGNPLKSKRGEYILHFLKNYVPNISRHLMPLWEQKIPELIAYLEGYKGTWKARVWEDMVLDFLSATLSEMDEEKWTMGLGVKLMEQVALYTNYPEERCMLYKLLAVTVCHTMDPQFINHQLDVMLSSMKQQSFGESKACARAVGICSRNHLELVLLRLEKLSKEELSRKSSRMLLGFMKDTRQEGEMERVRLALLLCYAEVALEAPGTQLIPQLERGITQWVTEQLHAAKEPLIREASLKAIGNIAEALHPNRNSLHIVLQSRSQMLNLVLTQLRPQYSNVGLNSRRLELYPTVLQVATALIKLPPSLSADERVAVLKTCFDRVYHAASLMAGDDIIQTPDDVTGDIINNMDVKWAEHMAAILSCLNSLVQQLLLDTVTPATLDDIFTLLEPWLSKESSYQRAAAVSTLHSVLQCYLDNMNFGYETPSKFTQTGLILGRVVPRCTDPNLALRAEAVDCVRLVLSLAARYEGHIVDNDLTGDMSKLKEKIQTDDPKELFKVTSELAKIMCAKLPHFQLIHFCNSLLDALLDSEPCSSSGASVVLNVLLKSNGGELYHQVNDIMNVVLEKMENITCVQTRNGSVRVILSLAHHHLKAVISGLLNQPLPYAASVVECWTMLAQDHSLSADIIEHFLNAINGSQLYEEIHDKDKLRVVTLQPLASITAMHEMFRLATMQEIAVLRFPELFSCLLIAVGCYIGASTPVYTPRNANGRKDSATFIPNRNAYKLNPARMALDAFKSFLLCAKCESLAEALLLCTHIEMGDNLTSFLDMMPSLVRSLCVRMPQSLPRLVTCLNQYGTSTYEPQRIVVVAFYAELINLNCNGQIILLESILNNMLNCGNDPSPIVRQLCLKGLSSIAHLEKEQMNRHYQPVLSALVQGLDDHDHNSIPLEAMRGFSRMLQAVDMNHVQGVQVSVALRIKPFFENENPSIREAAIRMFGDLAKYGGTSSKAAFQEQVSSNFVCLLLHLDDENKHVIKACKYALRQVSPLLGAEKINVMIQDHLIDVANLHYPDFVADLVKIMVEELPDLVPVQVMNALVYVKSAWPVIRGNAAMLIGFLYGSFPVSDGISKAVADTVCARLVLLLQDEDQSVRAKAAKALSCLVTE